MSKNNFLKNYFFVGILGRSMTKIAGSGSASGSGFISQRIGYADPDPDPDPPQNVMDPQRCLPQRTSKLQEKSLYLKREHPVRET
jgi:hypothetical protein